VEAIEQQTSVMEREVEVVGRAGQALTRIQQVSTETARIVDTINRVSEEQAVAMRSVEDRISEIATIARKSLLSAKTTVEQLNTLRSSSDVLTSNVRKFKVA
jgi:methyl-accepting chemotaxis protein